MTRVDDDAAGREAARLRYLREVRNTVIGGALVIGAVLVLVVSVWANSLSLIAAGTSLGLAIAGGLFVEPKTFRSVAGKALDALPGGKR